MKDIEALPALRIAQTGLSPAELLALPMDEYARATGRATPVQAALRSLDAQQPPATSQTVQEAPTATRDQQPPGIDVNSDEFFHAWRAQRVSGGEGVGLLNQPASQPWADAAHAKAGRHGWVTTNVVESPQLTGRFVNHEAQRDPRTAAERFGSPSNAFNL